MNDTLSSPVSGSSSEASVPLVEIANLKKTFVRKKASPVRALDGISMRVERAGITALVGPDGAGKTTLMRLMAGLLPKDGGTLKVLGYDVDTDPQAVQERIGYMPQAFGLYEDLSVRENLDLYAELHGVAPAEREERYRVLLDMTGLGPFQSRPSGKLSGGMKQKLGLACTLVRQPPLLLLDEPTVGVDPLSRRELWDIIRKLTAESGLGVVLSTISIDEAVFCDQVLVLDDGQTLAQGSPDSIRRQAEGLCYAASPAPGDTMRRLQARLLETKGAIDALPQGGNVRLVHPSPEAPDVKEALKGASLKPVEAGLEDGVMVLLRRKEGAPASPPPPMKTAVLKTEKGSGGPMVEACDVTRRFGDFVAVNHVSFTVQRGEVFGLLGPNGAGKTTTFRMLCGLLPASGGVLRIAGVDVRETREAARQKLGYVAQKFSLYGPLSVRENLEFFAGAYGLKGQERRTRIEEIVADFSLQSQLDTAADNAPGGYKRRLAMGAALLHRPELLFLDEPTSGADPLARREFWQRISALAEGGTTIIVTTHFMEEAEYCDRILIQDSGRMLVLDTPERIRAHAAEERGVPLASLSMEEAFIAVIEEARRKEASAPESETTA